jgi:hypothetical protein
MGTTYLDRRQVLKGLGIGALAAGATAALSPVTALAEGDPHSPLGAWNITIRPNGQPSRPAIVAFAEGGSFITVDSLAPGAVGPGAWNQREAKKFAFKFTVFDFSQGTAVPVVVAGTGTATGNSIQGSFSATVFGTPAGTGTFDGTRMTV